MTFWSSRPMIGAAEPLLSGSASSRQASDLMKAPKASSKPHTPWIVFTADPVDDRQGWERRVEAVAVPEGVRSQERAADLLANGRYLVPCRWLGSVAVRHRPVGGRLHLLAVTI